MIETSEMSGFLWCPKEDASSRIWICQSTVSRRVCPYQQEGAQLLLEEKALLRILMVCAGAATMGLDSLTSTIMKLMGDQSHIETLSFQN